MIDPEQHIRSFYDQTPELGGIKKIEKLSGGNLNFVFRIWNTSEDTQIAKYAPPFIAVLPEIDMDADRILIEIKLMELLGQGPLSDVSSEEIRPPDLIAKSESEHLFVMEDIRNSVSLDTSLLNGNISVESGRLLGEFIGKLHKKSVGLNEAREITNKPVQKTRLEVQYKSLANLLKELKVDEADKLGQRIIDLGERFLLPGKCLLMGDLWPRSILVQGKNVLKIIDWEFSHFGRPCQDIAHFAAHCWLLGSNEPKAKNKILSFYNSFRDSYKQSLGVVFDDLWNEQEMKDASIHFGCEILVRTHGSFKSGYLFEQDKNPDQQFLNRSLERSISAIKEFNFSI